MEGCFGELTLLLRIGGGKRVGRFCITKPQSFHDLGHAAERVRMSPLALHVCGDEFKCPVMLGCKANFMRGRIRYSLFQLFRCSFVNRVGAPDECLSCRAGSPPFSYA